MKKRGSGVLLHPTSLPSLFGVGDMGPGAYRFVDFLTEAKQHYWQILPLNPTDPAHYNSPYHSVSAFAANPLLLSPERLVEEGLLNREDIREVPNFPSERADYRAVIGYKEKLFVEVHERFTRRKSDPEFAGYCHDNQHWLDDFALFAALKSHFGGKVWSEWPKDVRDRKPGALTGASRELSARIAKQKILQYLFAMQWRNLKDHCNEKGIQIIGDIPIYLNYDSADVWAHPGLFKLDDQKRPYAVSGVPPDYFSETGQLWGNPLYNWDTLRESGYDWWVQRIARTLSLYDFVRIDHFRGLVAYWEVPATEETAINGQWIEAPVKDFLTHLSRKLPYLPIIAEDLGVITPDVVEVMNQFDLPGMKILLFAFGQDMPTNPYIPHNFISNCVAYTGTHDNDTVKGWFKNELSEEERMRLFLYLGREVPLDELHWELIRLVMMSVANTVIFPIQDILGLDAEARMNRPATLSGNWTWRLLPGLITDEVTARLREMTETYGRV
jgi:4-alpha-glucanotransferase